MTRHLLALALMAASAMAASTPAADAAKAPEITFRAFGSWGLLSQYKDYERPFWTDTVPALTGGRVAVDITPFDQAGLKGSEMVRLLNLGSVDIGTTVLSYISDQDPIVEGVDLSGMAQDAASARRIADAFAPAMARHFEQKYGIRMLALWPYPAQMLMCKAPIAGLDDLKGKKVRVSLRTNSDLLESLGAVTLSIPFNEVYAKIRDGAVDCLVTGTLSANAAKLYEVTHYLYNLPMGWSTIMLGMTQASWNRLAPRDQAALAQGIATLADTMWHVADVQTAQGLACNAGQDSCRLGQKGAMKLVAASARDRERIDRIVPEVVVKRWFERCGAACASQWSESVGRLPRIGAAK